MLVKLYFGHVGAWATLMILSMFLRGKGTIKVFDITVISLMFAIFSTLAHYFLFT